MSLTVSKQLSPHLILFCKCAWALFKFWINIINSNTCIKYCIHKTRGFFLFCGKFGMKEKKESDNGDWRFTSEAYWPGHISEFWVVEPRNKRRLNKIQDSIWVQICSIQLSAIWEKTPWHKLESLLALWVSMQRGWGWRLGKGEVLWFLHWGRSFWKEDFPLSQAPPPLSPSLPSFLIAQAASVPSSLKCLQQTAPATHTLPYQGLRPRNMLVYITWNSGEQMPSRHFISPLVTSLSSLPREAHQLLLLLGATPNPHPHCPPLLSGLSGVLHGCPGSGTRPSTTVRSSETPLSSEAFSVRWGRSSYMTQPSDTRCPLDTYPSPQGPLPASCL